MDSEGVFSNVAFLGSSGVVLSVEQKASLQSSLVLLQREHKFRKTKVWGVIRGIQSDYFIVQGVGKDELKDRKALYSQDCMQWSLLPFADRGLRTKAALLHGRFTGDPSFVYEHTVTHRVGEGENAQEQTTAIELKEEDRLAAVVATIDQEVGVVPKGAFMKTPLGEVVVNKSFQGLSLADAKRLNYYFHFREPSNSSDDAKNTISQSIDFLDTIEKDIPKGCWSLQSEQGGVVVLRSLQWPGLVAYHVPHTPNHGYLYCGNGERNPDILFML